MPFNVKDTNRRNKENKECEYMEISDYSVSNVRVLSETAVSFTLKIKGATFYNMRVVESKEGKLFISCPQIKAKNGKYYYQYYLSIDEQTQEDIIALVTKVLEDDEIPFE